MSGTRRTFLASGAAASLALGARPGRAQGQVIRLGVLTDLSGPLRDTSGQTTVACVQQAAEDFRAIAPGIRVEVVSADHQNKPDLGVTIARRWFDQQDVDEGLLRVVDGGLHDRFGLLVRARREEQHVDLLR